MFGDELSKGKSPEKKEAASTGKEDMVLPKRQPMTTRKRQKPTSLVPYASSDVWRNFDRIFERFRNDFEDLLWPSIGSLVPAFPMMPEMETRIPFVDLEDRGKDFLLTAEMPGFRKEDVAIHVMDDSIEIKAETGWKYDDKTKSYVCRERACESFYRKVALPEEIKPDSAEATLKDGVMEIILPKKSPKRKKKVEVK